MFGNGRLAHLEIQPEFSALAFLCPPSAVAAETQAMVNITACVISSGPEMETDNTRCLLARGSSF
jgi:hypothetical protein